MTFASLRSAARTVKRLPVVAIGVLANRQDRLGRALRAVGVRACCRLPVLSAGGAWESMQRHGAEALCGVPRDGRWFFARLPRRLTWDGCNMADAAGGWAVGFRVLPRHVAPVAGWLSAEQRRSNAIRAAGISTRKDCYGLVPRDNDRESYAKRMLEGLLLGDEKITSALHRAWPAADYLTRGEAVPWDALLATADRWLNMVNAWERAAAEVTAEAQRLEPHRAVTPGPVLATWFGAPEVTRIAV